MKKYIFFLIAAFLLFSCVTSTETSTSKTKTDAAKTAALAAQTAEYSLEVSLNDTYDGTKNKITEGTDADALSTIRNIYLNKTYKFKLETPAVKNDKTAIKGATFTKYEITFKGHAKDKLKTEGKESTDLAKVEGSTDAYVLESADLHFNLEMSDDVETSRDITKVVAHGTTSDGKAFKATTAATYSVNLYTKMVFTDGDNTAVDAIHGLFTTVEENINEPVGPAKFSTLSGTNVPIADFTNWENPIAAGNGAAITDDKVVSITVSGKLTGNYPKGLMLFVEKVATYVDAYVALGENAIADVDGSKVALQGYEITVDAEDVIAPVTIYVKNKKVANKCYFDLFLTTQATNTGDAAAAKIGTDKGGFNDFQLKIGS